MSDPVEQHPAPPPPAQTSSDGAGDEALQGDWSAGLRGPVRASGLPLPRLLAIASGPARPASVPPASVPPATPPPAPQIAPRARPAPPQAAPSAPPPETAAPPAAAAPEPAAAAPASDDGSQARPSSPARGGAGATEGADATGALQSPAPASARAPADGAAAAPPEPEVAAPSPAAAPISAPQAAAPPPAPAAPAAAAPSAPVPATAAPASPAPEDAVDPFAAPEIVPILAPAVAPAAAQEPAPAALPSVDAVEWTIPAPQEAAADLSGWGTHAATAGAPAWATPAAETPGEVWPPPPALEAAPSASSAPGAADWGSAPPTSDWDPPAKAASPSGGWGHAAPPQAPAPDGDWAAAAPGPAAAQAGPVSAAEPDEWAVPAVAPQASRDAGRPAWSPVQGNTYDQLEAAEPTWTPGETRFAPLAPGETLAGDDDAIPGALDAPLGEPLPGDEDLLVPIDDDPAVEAARRPATPPPTGPLVVLGEHRVAVHTRAGRTRRGTVRDVDLSQSSFLLEPLDGGAGEPVGAGEVKAVFFMLPPGEKPGPAAGPRVRVTFLDGRSIDGTRVGEEDAAGFFLVPSDAARTNTRRIFIAREAAQEVREV